MWSPALVLAAAQLCVGLPRQEQQEQVEEVDILKGATVNCKVSATVTYPETAGGDELPTLKCDTKCSFNTNEKNKMYFLGYAYRHFDRLEREYGLMVEIRYNKGTTKGCKLVSAATNDEVFFKHEGTHLENPMEDDSDQTSLTPDAESTVMPAEHPMENDSEQTSLPPDAESTVELAENSMENESEQKSVPPHVPSTVLPAKLPINNDTEQTTMSSIAPSSSLVTEFQENHDRESTTLSSVEQSTAVPEEHPTQEDSEQTMLSDIAPSTVVHKELSMKDDSDPIALSSIAPSAELFTEPSLKHEPNPTIISTILPPTEIPTKQSVKSESKPIVRSTVQLPTILSTELSKNEDHDPSIMSSREPHTSMPSEKEPTADNNKIDSSLMILPTNDQQNGVSSEVFTEPTPKYQKDDITSEIITEPTPTLFSHFEVSSLGSTTLFDEEPKWVLIGTAYFHISRVRGDWKKGQKYCEGIGATLASIRSQEEQDALADLLLDDAWIGLHDMQKEDEHIWEDHSEISYTKWQPGEPANGYFWFFQLWGEEDCVEMRENHYFRWNDQDCHKHNLFICRRDNETLAGTNESMEGTQESLEGTEATDLFNLFLG